MGPHQSYAFYAIQSAIFLTRIKIKWICVWNRGFCTREPSPVPFSAFCSYFYAPCPLILCVLSIFCNNLLLLYPAQSLQHCQFLLSLTALLHSLFAYTVCVPFNNKYQQRRFEIACVRLNSFEITLKTVWIHFLIKRLFIIGIGTAQKSPSIYCRGKGHFFTYPRKKFIFLL